MAYHNGSVWPHDNASHRSRILSIWNASELAAHILTGMFEAGIYFDLNRMPELFCGFEA